ncbi:MAG: hypothetical protein HN405_04885 [Planctomycetes bacterium]|jgi:photosystem II stability/assembly factor-like uncharacterized protein|nr:hypothetical protein [Planctomycetota bacterium]MBT4029575.1 hypothetical protein [Planctomycetota bacterium]MBT4560555.1 hypothetical protein [Planctomycetota bacterium]MBT5101586.1 hypothetical protein [Planctomycetota bacterium]MBT7318549.1 hypothetical protein [Planctomycetota bacterium]
MRYFAPFCLFVLLVSCQVEKNESLGLVFDIPPPTEHRLAADVETKHKTARKAWQAAMHRAEEGVNWKAIERQNGLDAMARRQNALMAPAAPGSPWWRELGSRNLAGRMHAVRLSSDGLKLYGGSSKGGVWRGDLDGSNWQPLSDNLYGGGHQLIVVPPVGAGPDIMIRGAGSDLNRSVNDGVTWDKVSGVSGSVRRLIQTAGANPIQFVLTKSGNTSRLYRSQDSGLSFTLVRTNTTQPMDVWTSRTGASSLFLFEGQRLYESTNAGTSFQALGSPLSFSPTDVYLGCFETNTQAHVIAANASSGWQLWRTEDGGQSWSKKTDMSDFWGQLCTGTQSDKLVAWGGMEFWLSRTGGASPQKPNNWWDYYSDMDHSLHADMMGIYCYPDSSHSYGETWYIGTDGGVYESRDRLRNYDNLSLGGLGVSQYYDVLTSRRNPDLVLAGAQDQGYQRGDLSLSTPGGPGPWADFVQLISGDYGHFASTNGAHDLVYCTYPGFILVQVDEDWPSLPFVDFPSGSSPLWLPPVVAHPTDGDSFFFLAETLYRYDRVGTSTSWNATTHTSFDFGGTLGALAFSPLDSNRAYAATTNGNLFYSHDGGLTWSQSSSTGPGSHYFYGMTLLPSLVDVDTVWVGGSGYSTGPVKRSVDGGQTWQAKRNGMPDTLVYGLAWAPDGSGHIFAATETGAYEFEPINRIWSDILGTNAPITTYWSVESVPSQNLIRFGTYGRGIWDYHLETAGFFPYGELRGGANTLTLSADTAPVIGQNVQLTVSGAPANANGRIGVSTQSQDMAYMSGTLLVDTAHVALELSTHADSMGVVQINVTVPNNPNFVGQEFYIQAMAIDASQPNGQAFSQGLRAVVGD